MQESRSETLEHPATDTEWCCEFYDEIYSDLYLSQSPNEDLASTLGFLEEVLRIVPGDTVFDQCCGIGRISIPLASRGRCRIIGVDQSAAYIEQAQSLSQKTNLVSSFVQADAYDFVTEEPCDAAFNWYASCGNNRDDRVNRQMFERAYESLRPGGWFACDYLNVPRLFGDGCKSVEICHESPQGDFTAYWQSTPVFETGMLQVEVTLTSVDGSQRITKAGESRLYMPHELIGLLTQCGFSGFRLYGSSCGAPLTSDSGHCIVVCQKPE